MTQKGLRLTYWPLSCFKTVVVLTGLGPYASLFFTLYPHRWTRIFLFVWIHCLSVGSGGCLELSYFSDVVVKVHLSRSRQSKLTLMILVHSGCLAALNLGLRRWCTAAEWQNDICCPTPHSPMRCMEPSCLHNYGGCVVAMSRIQHLRALSATPLVCPCTLLPCTPEYVSWTQLVVPAFSWVNAIHPALVQKHVTGKFRPHFLPFSIHIQLRGLWTGSSAS